jgi:hypothetical protein
MTTEQIIQSLESVQAVLEIIEQTATWKVLSDDLSHVEIAQDMELAQTYICEIIRVIKGNQNN